MHRRFYLIILFKEFIPTILLKKNISLLGLETFPINQIYIRSTKHLFNTLNMKKILYLCFKHFCLHYKMFLIKSMFF